MLKNVYLWCKWDILKIKAVLKYILNKDLNNLNINFEALKQNTIPSSHWLHFEIIETTKFRIQCVLQNVNIEDSSSTTDTHNSQ